MRTRSRWLPAAFSLAGLLLAAAAAPAATLPPSFQENIVIQGRTNPTAIRFGPAGQIFVAEKSGMPAAVRTLDVAGGDHLAVSLVIQEPQKAATPPVVVMAPPTKEREPAPPR